MRTGETGPRGSVAAPNPYQVTRLFRRGLGAGREWWERCGESLF